MANANPKLNVLVIDDDQSVGDLLKEYLKSSANVKMALDAAGGLKIFKETPIQVLFLDLTLPDQNGMSVLKEVKEIDPAVEVVMVTGDASAGSAVEAMKAGAYDYITKPFDENRVKTVMGKISERMSAAVELELLRSEIKRAQIENELVGESEPMQKVLQQIKKASGNDTPVLIWGEIGTGKELAARTIHKQGPRAQRPFVVASFSDGNDTQIERSLLGWRQGAFADAKTAQKGNLELAEGGTIFLDEINKAGEALQSKILQILKEGTFTRVGETRQRKLNARIIASSSEDLYLEVQSGLFSEDLLDALEGTLIEMPNLKARGKDLAALARHFIKMEIKRRNKSIRSVNGKVMNAFVKYAWPGNVRELKSICERLVILARPGELIDVDRLPPEIYSGAARGRKIPGLRGKFEYDERLYDVMDRLEREYIIKMLQKYNYNQSHTARVLGIHRNTLLLKLKFLKIPIEKRRRRIKVRPI